jgi:DNA-binding response OmpR family regulator
MSVGSIAAASATPDLMKILLVEDDRMLADELADALRREHFAVDIARDGEDAHHAGDTTPYDAVVLDLGLPKKSGIAVLREWRAADRALPVLILTARDGWSEKVEGFKAGADDYLTKPFRVEELIMRLRALVRRSAGHNGTRITCGPLTFDSQTGLFEKDGLPLKLTALEWRVLECLMLRKNVAVDRSTLVEKIYDGDVGTDSNSLEVIVARLRRKIGHELIETERGRGYRLVAGIR